MKINLRECYIIIDRNFIKVKRFALIMQVYLQILFFYDKILFKKSILK